MDLTNITQWIAITITLCISILVPLFTQIANNKHNKKMHDEKLKRKEETAKKRIYKKFLSKVGGLVLYGNYTEDKDFYKATCALNELYLYCPTEWFDLIRNLSEDISKRNWGVARVDFEKLSLKISKELNSDN